MKPVVFTFAMTLALAPIAEAAPPLSRIAPSSLATRPFRHGGSWQRPAAVQITSLSLSEKIKRAGLTMHTQSHQPPAPPTHLNVTTLEGTYGSMAFYSPVEVWGGGDSGASFAASPQGVDGSEVGLSLWAPQAGSTYLVDLVVTSYGSGALTIQGNTTGNPNIKLYPANLTQDVSLSGSSQTAQHIVFAYTAPQSGGYWFDIFSKNARWIFYSCEITELPGS